MSRKKGSTLSEEHKRKISEAHKGKKKPWVAELNKKRKGEKRSVEWIEKVRKRMIGKKYALGKRYSRKAESEKITPINEAIRKSTEYKLWRKAVFERDNYICIWCGQRGGKLNADHIKPFSLFPKLRFDIDNGRTLCENCHKKTDTYGRH